MLLVGMVIMSFGIALSVRSDLGTTTISSLPYVLSLISPLSLGTALILINAALLLVQVLLLRRRFPLIQLLQVPTLLVFGILNDAALWATSWISYSAYWQQWLLTIAAIVVLSLGIVLQITARSIMLSADAVVLTIASELSRAFGQRRIFVFGYVKIVFDIVLVLSSVTLALLFTGGIIGVGEGTVAAALFIGVVVKHLQRRLGPRLTHLL